MSLGSSFHILTKRLQTNIFEHQQNNELLVFSSNFFPSTNLFEIFDFKNAVTLKTGLGVRQGHWTCHRSIERMTSYLCSIVTMALSRVVSEIFNVEKCRDLEIGFRGHSRSLKVVPFDRLVWFPISVL